MAARVHEAAVAEVEAAVSTVKCCCCGLMEECTHAYIARVKERFGGRWICGLCAEAVKEEKVRSSQMITMDDALKRHIKFCQQFSSSSPRNDDFILAMKQILFRTLDSPRKERFTCRPLGRSHSCFSAMQATPPQAETRSEGVISKNESPQILSHSITVSDEAYLTRISGAKEISSGRGSIAIVMVRAHGKIVLYRGIEDAKMGSLCTMSYQKDSYFIDPLQLQVGKC